MRDIGDKFLALLLFPLLFRDVLKDDDRAGAAALIKTRFFQADAQGPLIALDGAADRFVAKQNSGLDSVFLPVLVEKILEVFRNGPRRQHLLGSRIRVDF